jgi:hypothetical protein
MSYDKPSNYQPNEQDAKKIELAFTYHAPKDDQARRYVDIREKAKALALTFTMHCPPSRELSLAITNLEQAVMWANSAIARNE